MKSEAIRRCGRGVVFIFEAMGGDVMNMRRNG
jgi:hypothetical protein